MESLFKITKIVVIFRQKSAEGWFFLDRICENFAINNGYDEINFFPDNVLLVCYCQFTVNDKC